MIFGLEHRYFGKSLPFDYHNKTSLQYLTVEQSLADLASFIKTQKSQYCIRDTCSVMVVGGSYPGVLSSWFRLRYPHLANFSWASSAPVDVRLTFPEYDGHVVNVLKSFRPMCYNETKALIDGYEKELLSDYPIRVRSLFNLGDMTVESALSALVDIIYYAVQYNNKYNLLSDFCETTVTEASFLALTDAILEKIQMTMSELDPLSMVSEDPSNEGRTWLWMTCNELGWFATPNGLLPERVGLEFNRKICRDIFGIEVGDVTRLNKRYGGTSPSSSFVLFSNGELDPYSELGVKNVQERNAQYSFYIDGASHCSDLASPGETDSNDLKRSRDQILKILRGWVQQKCHNLCDHGSCVNEHCLCDIGWSGEYCTFAVVKSELFWLVGITAFIVPLFVLSIVGGTGWWLLRRIQEDRFIQTLNF